jgi:hypothetical protein
MATQIYNPATKASVSVALPTTPTAVSASPDGLQAAVGHDGWVSIVNLQAAAVTATLASTQLTRTLADFGTPVYFTYAQFWSGGITCLPNRERWLSEDRRVGASGVC